MLANKRDLRVIHNIFPLIVANIVSHLCEIYLDDDLKLQN